MKGLPGKSRGRGPWLEAGHLLGAGVKLVFTDRHGGVSEPPFHWLNLAYHTGDDPRRVAANRAILASALGMEEELVAYPEQVHGVRVAWVSSRTRGAARFDAGTLRQTDGVLGRERGLTLAVLTADCVPIALHYPGYGVIAMLHAGWRGTIGDIVGAACRTIEADAGLCPSIARAVLGPSIGPCCYAVDEGRARLFVEKYGEDSGVVTRERGYAVDLRKANRMNMLGCGMRAENLFEVGGCTCCDPDYYSFRRDGITGRQGAFLRLDEEGG